MLRSATKRNDFGLSGPPSSDVAAPNELSDIGRQMLGNTSRMQATGNNVIEDQIVDFSVSASSSSALLDCGKRVGITRNGRVSPRIPALMPESERELGGG